VQLPHERVILFDGVCRFCSATVAFVFRHDPTARFHFLPIQSPLGSRLYREHGLDPDHPDTILVVDHGRTLARSDAVIAIGRGLGFPWSIAVIGLALPRCWRDWAYDFIAARRYRWFGRNESCLLPTPDLRARFLE
jgi:predicted DCC family thiol-disulfide oxidoreductase YuxK